jgi:transcriptional regulator with XRE-family HTH domain
MERNFRLDWPALVEEARRRRKAENLTQARLAAIADVSTPTVSRFEGGDKNIQLASVLAILNALGMIERSPIEFPEKAERFDPDRDAVLFSGRTAKGEVACAVSGEALEDRYGAKGVSARARIAAFRAHRREIEEEARRKFVARALEKDGSVLVRTADVGGER